MPEAMKLESAYPFAETLQRLQSALEAKGLTIFATIDQRAAAQSVGLDMPPTTLLVYGNPTGGTPPMLATPDFALDLPLKVLVREEAGGKIIVLYTPATLWKAGTAFPPAWPRSSGRRASDRCNHRGRIATRPAHATAANGDLKPWTDHASKGVDGGR